MNTILRGFIFFTMLTLTVEAKSNNLPETNKFLFNEVYANYSVGTSVQEAYYSFTKNGRLVNDIDSTQKLVDIKYKSSLERLKYQAISIKEYARLNNYNTELCFLIDMSIPSGKNRFFVYNIKNDVLEYSSLVAHGFGSAVKNNNEELIFSNNNFSYKTSLGKYKIGAPYKGTYGLSFKLHGLDSTNSNAFDRAIVLHSDAHVPENEIYPNLNFQSAGCPTVSPSFLPVLNKYISSSKKKILMWIYY